MQCFCKFEIVRPNFEKDKLPELKKSKAEEIYYYFTWYCFVDVRRQSNLIIRSTSR